MTMTKAQHPSIFSKMQSFLQNINFEKSKKSPHLFKVIITKLAQCKFLATCKLGRN
jgi:hypothetical protein